MPDHDDLQPLLKELTDVAIEECIRVKQLDDFALPFMLQTGREGTSLTVVTGPTKHAVQSAREDIRAQAAQLDAYVIAYDGTLKSRDGGDLEAFILECGEKPQQEGFVFFQRYTRDESGALVLVVGSGSLLRRTEQLLGS